MYVIYGIDTEPYYDTQSYHLFGYTATLQDAEQRVKEIWGRYNTKGRKMYWDIDWCKLEELTDFDETLVPVQLV